MPDDPKPPESGEPKAGAPKGDGDVSFWQAEAKKAFDYRDKAKERIRELEAKVLSETQLEEYERLRREAVVADEDRKRKAGEFDQWREQVTKQHAKERTELAEQKTAAERRLHDTLIGLAFAGATDYFGPNGRTILPPDVARTYYGRFVEVQSENGTEHLVVKSPDGQVILDPETGKPAPFERAMGTLIEALPTRDHVLRGSGKVGSGSPGGRMTPVRDADLRELTERARKGDKSALEALKEHQKGLGGLVFGSAFQK